MPVKTHSFFFEIRRARQPLISKLPGEPLVKPNINLWYCNHRNPLKESHLDYFRPLYPIKGRSRQMLVNVFFFLTSFNFQL